MKKNLLITFDYEIFLGARSGRAVENILNPTERIRSILNPKGIKAIFFVDATYLLTLEKYSDSYPACAKDLAEISDQLRQLLRDGHYIFPHIHSHWLDAVYDGDTHQFNLSNIIRYRFHNLVESDRELIFRESFRILSSILHKEDPNYKINGYRAGGWSIQPFTDFSPYFNQYGIEYDFSVMQKFYQFSNAQYFDFSDIPKKPIYRFNDDVTKEDKTGKFTEISSSVIEVKPYIRQLDRLHRKILYKILKDHTFTRGIGQQSKNIHNIRPASKKGYPTNNKKIEPASLELLSIVKLPTYYKYLKSNDYLHFVSHPKMLSQHNLYALLHFVNYAYKNFEVETDFIKIVQNYISI
jgi:peptidoglycan/xylan/chitin deacetylase (PgdA/CDA1 family)